MTDSRKTKTNGISVLFLPRIFYFPFVLFTDGCRLRILLNSNEKQQKIKMKKERIQKIFPLENASINKKKKSLYYYNLWSKNNKYRTH